MTTSWITWAGTILLADAEHVDFLAVIFGQYAKETSCMCLLIDPVLE
jgi:hypothetical protein